MKDNVHTTDINEDTEDKTVDVKMLFYLALVIINYAAS
ncbi:hypothetical protein CPter291_4494 [Collimonas pratensis]|uniref:Uncharacterized protein n=1 Tax=Collimonas pratensis TaxID=279113 RepID=A0ABM5ZCA0_9BURK|nr:hypothetical protein CPter291_4494 [Collimonas pratensis]